jgi:N-acetyl-1-D-myo-inositol-2-amino-2-deoxy-alpha-D-glucopyranoside deacetylase
VAPHRPTLVFVHAHPDDEASTTGGVLARYSAEGARTVLITCTNGELGDTPEGLAPDHVDHDVDEVVAHRLSELEESCRILGVERSELLGYHDSGMMEWPQKDAPGSFWTTPVEHAARRVADILDEEEADVVVTYDENGFYGHPDHIQANRVTLAAVEMAKKKPKVYYATVARSAFESLANQLKEYGIDPPEPDGDQPEMGATDDEIGAAIDVSKYVAAKRAALKAHSSQTAQSFFFQLPEGLFERMFGQEWFVRVADPTGQVGVEDDLLAGLR